MRYLSTDRTKKSLADEFFMAISKQDAAKNYFCLLLKVARDTDEYVTETKTEKLDSRVYVKLLESHEVFKLNAILLNIARGFIGICEDLGCNNQEKIDSWKQLGIGIFGQKLPNGVSKLLHDYKNLSDLVAKCEKDHALLDQKAFANTCLLFYNFATDYSCTIDSKRSATIQALYVELHERVSAQIIPNPTPSSTGDWVTQRRASI